MTQFRSILSDFGRATPDECVLLRLPRKGQKVSGSTITYCFIVELTSPTGVFVRGGDLDLSMRRLLTQGAHHMWQNMPQKTPHSVSAQVLLTGPHL